MEQPKKDIIIFGFYIIGLSIISIWVSITYDLEKGILFGGIFGVGILLCLSCRQMFMNDDEPKTKLTDSEGKK